MFILFEAEKFQEECSNQNRLPRTTTSFNSVAENAFNEAIKVSKKWKYVTIFVHRVVSIYLLLFSYQCILSVFHAQNFEENSVFAHGERLYQPFVATLKVILFAKLSVILIALCFVHLYTATFCASYVQHTVVSIQSAD